MILGLSVRLSLDRPSALTYKPKKFRMSAVRWDILASPRMDENGFVTVGTDLRLFDVITKARRSCREVHAITLCFSSDCLSNRMIQRHRLEE